jgi:hypothetical protein
MEGVRSGLGLGKIWRLLMLPWRPSLTRTLMVIDRIEDLTPEPLLAAGMRGVLLDADGTLAPHHDRDFNPSVIAAVARLRDAGLEVAIYTNASDAEVFGALGVPLATGLPAKPSRAGFRAAMAVLGLSDPAQVAMVGDSYITDGGAVEAGLHFIYCRPIPGHEPLGHKAMRGLSAAIARVWHR